MIYYLRLPMGLASLLLALQTFGQERPGSGGVGGGGPTNGQTATQVYGQIQSYGTTGQVAQTLSATVANTLADTNILIDLTTSTTLTRVGTNYTTGSGPTLVTVSQDGANSLWKYSTAASPNWATNQSGYVTGYYSANGAVAAQTIIYGALTLSTTAQVTATGGILAVTNNGVVTLSLYSAPTITAFANNQNPQEIGATVTSTILTWTRAGGPVTSLSLDNSIGSLATNLTSYVHTSSYTTARTYTLTASDGTTAATASTTVNFYSRIYWGASAQTASTITDGQIIALSGGSAYATTRTMTQTITSANNYMFVCYPAAWGAATFKVGGFDDTGWNLTTRNFTNASGGVVSYNIYQHWPANIGDYSVEVK
jgi:hypothetical protein